MKKPLLNQIMCSFERSKARAMTSLVVILLMAFMNIMNAQVITRSECSCLNNQTVQGNGQFSDTIIIKGPAGATWTVTSANGFYSDASPAPPAAPLAIAPGTVIPESPAGTYKLAGKRVDATLWSVVISNGTINLPLSAVHLCKYPRLEMFGDFGTCIGGLKSYNVQISNSSLKNATWSVTNGTILGPVNGNTLQVQWPFLVGVGNVSLNGFASSYDGQNDHLCAVNLSEAVAISDEDNVTMACNNLLNLSIGNVCELTVDPYMVLEAPQYPITSYDIILKDIQADTVIPNGRVNQAYLGKTLQVTVIHECTGNSCWGSVKLDDKSIPPLQCGPDVTIDCNQLTGPELTGFPLPPTATVTPLGGNKYLVKDFDLCSDVTLKYEDELSVAYCDGDFSSIIDRTWIATDISGNNSTCTNQIYVRKASIDDIVFPPNYDDVLGPNPSIDACANYTKLPNGNPDPSYTGMPTGIFCLNVQVDYTDIRIPICRGNNTFKIIRKWRVTDLCNLRDTTHNQTIAVMDTKAPVVVAPNDFTVGTEGITCASKIKVPPPIIIYECSNYEYYVTYKVPDANGVPTGEGLSDGVIKNSDGTYTLTKVPDGITRLWIKYKVVDDCDNATEVFTEVDIIDSTPPVPVCNQFTFVGLTEEGIGWAGVDAFDDGSWDNCGLDHLEVRRMENSSCGINNSFGSKAMFCCADVGKKIMIQLKAIDKAGNENSCMIEVTVQDNIPPTLSNCPKDITVGCDANLFNLSQYGTPTVSDVCGATLSESKVENYNTCGTGSVLRTFTATDNFGNSATCQQLITVQALNPFKVTDIIWPADHTVTNGCLDSGTDPEDLPANKQTPKWTTKPCSQVLSNYEDVVFQYVDGACFKILRKWTVIDWCQFNPFVPTIGKWEHTQVIKVQNNIAPTITKGCNDADISMTSVANCKSSVQILADGTDDCSKPENLDWTYDVDLNNNGTDDIHGTGKTFNRTMDFGTHKITWTVTDECGNSKTCSKVFVVRDTKNPTPYCLSEIATVLLENSGTAVIWASDFDRGSYDNCSDTSSLRFSFSPNVNDKSRTFTCDSLVTAITTFHLKVYVTDLQGNQDYCTVSMQIQDNNDFCHLDPGHTNRVAIAGKIQDAEASTISDVNVHLIADLAEFPKIGKTSDAGEFQFSDLFPNNNYVLAPTKDGDYNEGISTLDLVLIQRHILGVKKFDSPYKVIAADVSNDSKVTTVDLVSLRKLILGIETTLPKSPVWRFIDARQEFSNINNPFPYEESIILQDQTTDMMYNNFVAVKMGDVNLSASYRNGNEAENRNSNTFTYSDNTAKAGELMPITFTAKEVEEMKGFQFALHFDPSVAEFAGIEARGLKIDESNLGLQEISEGNIYISWSADNAKIADADMFDLVFKAKKDISSKGLLILNPNRLKAEVYQESENDIISNKLVLQAEGRNNNETFELFQNTPNPFNENTIIGFNLPESSDASLKVFDIQGKLILEKRGSFDKGYNRFELNAKELGSSGIHYYQVDTKNYSSNKMMIVIN